MTEGHDMMVRQWTMMMQGAWLVGLEAVPTQVPLPTTAGVVAAREIETETGISAMTAVVAEVATHSRKMCGGTGGSVLAIRRWHVSYTHQAESFCIFG